MGFSGLARWINAPTTGLELIHENITRNHQASFLGRWQLSLRSYRSTYGAPVTGTPSTGAAMPTANPERVMMTVTMNDAVFVMVEDQSAPTRSEVAHAAALHAQAQAQAAAQLQSQSEGSKDDSQPQTQSQTQSQPAAHVHPFIGPPHYRTTCVTLKDTGSLEQLLQLLRARWMPVRQATAPANRAQATSQGQHLAVDGRVYAIGKDWIVRAGNVILAGGAVKGMLLEAEYLPAPWIPQDTPDGTSELVTYILLSILPNVLDAKTMAVNVTDEQWLESLGPGEDELGEARDGKGDKNDDLFVYGDEEPLPDERTDWMGSRRDLRSSALIMSVLRGEGLL